MQVKKSTPTQQNLASSHKSSASSVSSEQKKKAGLKAKAYKRKEGSEVHVLEGADYVTLLLGSRRKAKEEAIKLPKDADMEG